MKIQSQTVLYFIIILVASSGLLFLTTMDQPAGFYALLISLGLGGLAVSANIWYTKFYKIQLVCPTGSDCNAVVNSRFSKFLGIKLEYMGILYFLIIAGTYLSFILKPELLQARGMVTAIVILTLAAALFSCYLLFVQAFILKKWCIWCILASILSLSIFFVSFISLPDWIDFLAEWTTAMEFVQFLGYALGLGSVTAGVFLFFKRFIRDRDIDDEEFDILKNFSELVWLGFGLVLLMQLAFSVVDNSLLQDGSFLAGLIALLISGFAGAVIMVFLSPYIVFIPFANTQRSTWLTKLRKPLFAFGAIGVTSWYFTFTTHFLPTYELINILTAYTIILLIAVLVAILWAQTLADSEPASHSENRPDGH